MLLCYGVTACWNLLECWWNYFSIGSWAPGT
nr:MAG TPA: hypothetical protein [Caudoviricetes sp.]